MKTEARGNTTQPGYGTLTAAALEELRSLLGPQSLIEDSRREAYAEDELKRSFLPDLVVEPRAVEEICSLMRWANRHRIPVTPRGAGTGLSGGALPVYGGVVLSLRRFDRILDIDPVNQIAVVEPGVINRDLQRAVEARGLFYPPDPSSNDSSCIGGNIAEDAGGPRCYKYGTTRQWVLQLEVVLPDGQCATLGVRTRKGVVGYDLKDLVIGSEGTLGIITRAVLRLVSLPEATRTLLALFPDFRSASSLVARLAGTGLVPSALEFMDERSLDLVRATLPLQLPDSCRAVLLLEVDGSEAALDAQSEALGACCLAAGALDILVAQGGEKRERLWEVRRSLSRVTRKAFAQKLSEDVVVPVDRIVDYLGRARELGDGAGLTVLGYGHLGDGNIHVNVLSAIEGAPERRKMQVLVGRLFELALSMGGTISGEHGVGCAKQPWISLEIPPVLMELQKNVKRLLDPNLVLNPGKMFDWPAPGAAERLGLDLVPQLTAEASNLSGRQS
ncbi:MAG: FAD-binding protein [Candidatus Delongbacteria bacterium]|nr:FAD-binding protein [Candidatus Cloacimonadota bacterium]MCB9473071.1 FAD-binding protein [Candidatus Delongbacteria bacterium]